MKWMNMWGKAPWAISGDSAVSLFGVHSFILGNCWCKLSFPFITTLPQMRVLFPSIPINSQNSKWWCMIKCVETFRSWLFFCIHHRPDGRNLFPRLEGYFYENILTVRKPRRYLYMFTTSLPKWVIQILPFQLPCSKLLDCSKFSEDSTGGFLNPRQLG